MRSVLRRIVGFTVPIVIGVVGSFTGMALWAKTTVSMGPFQVLLASRFGKGKAPNRAALQCAIRSVTFI